ncbi:MAG: YhfC family glutamic-type intramembrane protease [Anaerolineae bacterium]
MVKRTLRLMIVLTVGAIVLLTLAGCGASEGGPTPAQGASASSTLAEESAGETVALQVQVAQAGEPIGVDLRGAVQSGRLRAQLVDAGGEVVWQEAIDGPNVMVVNTVVNPPEPGDYELGLAWDGPVTASYSLTWAPGEVEVPRVTAVALIGGLGMMAVAAGFVIYAGLHRLGWRYLGLGALAWVVSVVLKFVWAVAFNQTVYGALQSALPEALADPVFALYVGALTGVFEVLLLWLVMRYSRLGRMTWGQALAFGIGFGAVEALLLGLQSLANAAFALATPALVPIGPEAIAQMNNPLLQLAPIVERFFAILLHIFACLLVIYAVRTRQARWLWLAFVYKTGIDTVAAFAQIRGLVTYPAIWAIEAVVAVWGIAGWLGIRWLRERWDDTDQEPTTEGPRTEAGSS